MANGVTTDNLDEASTITELIANGETGTVLISFENLAKLLANSGDVADQLAVNVVSLDGLTTRMTSVEDTQTTNQIVETAWTDGLADLTPTIVGQGAEILDSATGAHTDPVTLESVSDAGRYKGYALTLGAWERIGDTGLGSKADKYVETGLAAVEINLTAVETDIADKADKSTIDIGQRSDGMMEFLDARGFVGVQFSPYKIYSTLFECGPDMLRAGGIEVTSSADIDRPVLRDQRGFEFGLIGINDVMSVEDVSGVYLRDQRGFEIKLNGAASAATAAATAETVDDTHEISTDGRSLYAMRAALSILLESASGVAKFVMVGDSWTERDTISNPFAKMLHDLYGQGASGYVSLSQTTGELNDISVSFSGFTEHDITSERNDSAGPYGPCGGWLEATGTTETASVSGIYGSSINIYYEDGDGTFRYSVDGGSWVDVVGGSTGDAAKVSITGLDIATAHTVDIDTTGNSGTVSLVGLYATGIDGVEFSKAGNAGAISTDYNLYIANGMCVLVLADIAPQAIMVSLGTNCVSSNKSPTAYKTAVSGIVAAYQSAYENCSCLLVGAPESSRTGTYEMSDYTDACFEIASENDLVDAYDMLSMFGPYSVTSGLGVWADSAHLNDDGGRMFASLIFSQFYKLA
ncbi:SGNH/GDSL hydrolase family protein [Pacificibacter sp. AS14]|uniref:SGNH/GDSL hydrolase family protein n=1 Tax=Pacificibacter sp. AS14 TaxID=3135785 RepID=UPI003172CFFF